jgi:hypothetical protein
MPNERSAPTVRTETVIMAPRKAVWDVLVDFPKYEAWNPFTVRVRTTAQLGEPVFMDVEMGSRRMKLKERIRVHEPHRRIGWWLRIGGGLLLDCTRVQELEDVAGGGTRYVCYESFRGLLVPLFFRRYQARMQRGFDAAARALKERVESLSCSSQ